MSAPHFAPVIRAVDPDRPDNNLTTDELASRIVGMSGRLAASMCRWLLLVADFDRREGAGRFGLHSTAYWLAHHCGIARRTAVEHVRVARALVAFPDLAGEMAAGRLSYSQVRAISRVPRDGEHQVVTDLIGVARNGTAAQLESIITGMRCADRTDHPVPEPEYLRTSWTSTGKRRLAARLGAEHGAVVDSALARVAKAENITTAEALVRMAEWALAIVADERDTPRELRGDEYAAIVVHVDAATYPAEHTDAEHTDAEQTAQARSAERAPGSEPASEPGPAGRIADGPGLSHQVIERLACAGRVRLILHDGDANPLDLGRSSRTVTTKLFRAVLERDRHCRHPGCTSTRKLEAHHVTHWLHGGRTDLANLVLLCEAHHKAHHAGEFTLTAGDRPQRWRFLRHDGRELLRVIHPDQYPDSRVAADAEPDTEHLAAGTHWDGQRLDRHYAISVLAQRRAALDNQRAS